MTGGAAQNLAKAGSGYGPASIDFSDASWRRVDWPHDWAVELPFDAKADGAHGFRPVGDGDPSSHEPDKFVAAPTLRTRALDD